MADKEVAQSPEFDKRDLAWPQNGGTPGQADRRDRMSCRRVSGTSTSPPHRGELRRIAKMSGTGRYSRRTPLRATIHERLPNPLNTVDRTVRIGVGWRRLECELLEIARPASVPSVWGFPTATWIFNRKSRPRESPIPRRRYSGEHGGRAREVRNIEHRGVGGNARDRLLLSH